MADSVERLLVRIDATSEQLRRELASTDRAMVSSDSTISKRLSNMRDGFNRTAERAGKFGLAVGAAGAAITAKLVASGLQSVDSLAKVSSRLGIATEDLAALRFAAEQTGVSTSTLDMAMQRMTRRVAEAAQGTGEAKGALKELGLSAEALANQAPDKMFREITAAMQGVGNQSDKVRLAMKLFDSEGVSLVQTMKAGTAGLDEFADQARLAGLTLSQFDAAKVEAANDAMNRVRAQVTGLSQQMAVRFAPILEGIADRLFGVGNEAGGMASIADKAFGSMIKAAGLFGNAIVALQLGWHGMKLAFQEAARFIMSGLDRLISGAIALYNKLPWVDRVEVESMFGGFLATMDSEIAASSKKIGELLSRPLPSDAIEEFAETHTRVFSAAAIEVGTLTESTETLKATTTEATKSLASDWDKALQGTFERIDSAFADAWRGAFDSFSDFADGLKSAFKNLLAEMAHLAITKPILMNFGAAMGIGSVSSAAGASGVGSALSSASSISSMLSGGFSGLLGGVGNAASGLYNTIGHGAQFLGLEGVASSAYQQGMTVTGAGALGNIGAGIVGNLLGSAVFGQTSGIGSAVGGIAGSFFGPLGAGVGSFIGSGLESMIGNKQPTDKTGTALLDLSSGSVGIGGLTGKKFSQENRDAAGQLAQQFLAFAQSIGGSSGSLNIGVGSRDGLRLNGRDYGDDIDGFLDAGFNQIISSATALDPILKRLVQSFDGTAEELNVFAQSMIGISNAVGSNVVTQMRDAWAQQSTNTAVSAYYAQIDAIDQLVNDFDRSAASALTLNQALAQNQMAAVQLAASIMNVSAQIKGMFASSAQQIRESAMSEAQLFAARKEERNQLQASINTLTDADEIGRVTAEINRLNLALFNSLNNPSQEYAEAFARFAENTDQAAQQRLTTILDKVENSQTAQNQRIQNMMESAATTQQEAADTMLVAAQTFATAFRSGELGV